MKLACVVHRFGADIAGGSEAHCRAIAERLAERHEVTVLTTTATNHITWANEYAAGESRVGRLRVRRFPVARQRSLHRFAELSEVAFSRSASAEDEAGWFRENGPETPALLDYLREHGRTFDRILFWSFRYFQTFFGLPLVKDRAVLVPTAEDDPVMRFDSLGPFFSLPAGFVFLTLEEQALVARRADRPLAPSCVIGSGLDPAPSSPRARPSGLDVAPPFALYLGRIDPNKGCGTLLRHYIRYASEAASPVSLVMAGPANMPVPDHPRIRCLGYIDEATRIWLLSRASLLIVPSPYESLSMVLLEAWNHAVPALVNGRCEVLEGQSLRANGALWYRTYDEFAACLEYVFRHPDTARRLGRQGQAYIDREYRWPHVVGTLDAFLGSLATRAEAV